MELFAHALLVFLAFVFAAVFLENKRYITMARERRYQFKQVKILGRFTYIAPHLRMQPSAALSSQTGLSFSLDRSQPSLHTQNLCTDVHRICVLTDG